MSKVMIIVADDTSAASLAHIAKESGASGEAIVFGSPERAADVAEYDGIDAVVRYDTDAMMAEAWAPIVAETVASEPPAAIVTTDNAFARVVAGAIAAKIGAVAVSSVVRVQIEGGQTLVHHAVAEGAAVNVLSTDKPVACIIGDGGEEADKGAAAPVTDASAPAAPASMEIVSTNMETGGAANLAHAERVVSVGLGVGDKENLAAVEELAQALGAEMACTLPLCDTLRWFEHSSVVGTSTQKISPRLYLTCGASGQPQHMTGVRGAKMIVAVNNDPEAPIMSQCAYGILGDMNKVVPALTAAIKNL